MTTDFTGTSTWHTTISGPADLEDATGDSVSDMGVLLADRTIWLKDAIVDGLQLVAYDYYATGTVALITDLKASTSYIAITGVEVALGADVLAGDVVLVRASCMVRHDATTVMTDYTQLAIDLLAAPGVALASQWCSSAAEIVVPMSVEVRLEATGTLTTPTFRLVGKSSTVNCTQSEVWGPARIEVLHLRPVAEP